MSFKFSCLFSTIFHEVTSEWKIKITVQSPRFVVFKCVSSVSNVVVVLPLMRQLICIFAAMMKKASQSTRADNDFSSKEKEKPFCFACEISWFKLHMQTSPKTRYVNNKK